MAESLDLTIKWRSFDWLAPWEPVSVDFYILFFFPVLTIFQGGLADELLFRTQKRFIGPWRRYHKFLHGLRPLLATNEERQAYLDYYDRIGRLVPPDQLLYFNVAEGWEPLCKFLGKEVPATQFPKANNTNVERRRIF